MAGARTLTADEWSRAALDAIAAVGVGSVTVEGLARRLGVTKGSFYWHFVDRAALIASALELWERVSTADVIGGLNEIADPAARLRALFDAAYSDAAGGPVDAALVAASDDPIVEAVVRRVYIRRIQFLEAAYGELGLNRVASAVQARLVYCTYIGYFQVRRALIDDRVLATPTEAYRRRLMDTLIPEIDEAAKG